MRSYFNRANSYKIFALIGVSAFYCQHSAKADWWELSQVPSAFKFQYVPEDTSNSEFLNLSLQIRDTKTCIEAGEHPNYFASLCMEDSRQTIREGLNRLVNGWRQNELMAPLFFEDSKSRISITIGIYKINELRKQILPARSGILGSREIRKDLADGVLFFDRNHYSRKFHTASFSVFLLSDTETLWIHPPAGDGDLYLSIKIEAGIDLGDELKNTIASISGKNAKILSNCKSELPVISEVFGETESVTGRWIELFNSKQYPICEAGMEFVLFGNRVVLPKTTGHFLPGETRVYAEESSSLERIPVSGLRWGDLKRNGSLQLSKQELLTERILPGGGYRYGSETLSWKPAGFSECGSNRQLPYLPESYCMDPGFPAGVNPLLGKEFPGCDPRDFILEELNPIGIYWEGKLRSDLKFIDLEYIGYRECKPENLEFQWAQSTVPISTTGSIKEKSILTVGALPFLFGAATVSYRNLSSLKLSDPFQLRDRMTGVTHSIWDGAGIIETPNRFALEIPGVATSSLLIRNNRTYLPLRGEVFAGIHHLHRVFPGKKTGFEFSGRSLLSEISWAGSYKGIEPIASDRFLEVQSETEAAHSALLEVETDSGSITSALFPIDVGFSVLSSGKLICFPQSLVWKDSGFSLPQTGSTIVKLRHPVTGELWDELRYSSAGPGKNDTRNKIRRSGYQFIDSNGHRSWKDSDISESIDRLPECFNTHASPGSSNLSTARQE
ncbi:hypothetical protein LEP1GSC058_2280 [Leptospira fainei serovar Hurstbridge str. BUT 6]|uniref:Lipoprotein n=1 Tax=Leptospira fainei serovar Hurstbridge str. BUT 6 TaxID=1193011 RepID=S3V481_9LEPT|nr:hypothetical protein [Leptospira fainei]EPG75434.1 hypothetical protein LEP1GSC058_2280 [Leptospira fainei serovar Hurstbridge str. BUT 6]